MPRTAKKPDDKKKPAAGGKKPAAGGKKPLPFEKKSDKKSGSGKKK
jgi:hypothetical protein